MSKLLSVLLLCCFAFPFPAAFAATVDSGTHVVIPDCPESPCTSYRFVPFCLDANKDGVCDGYSAKTWTQSSAISTVTKVCNAGSDATADPDIHPGFSATGLPPGIAISATTGSITGTPTTPGSGTIVVTCANDLGSRTDSLVYTINASGAAGVVATGYFVDELDGLDTNTGTSWNNAWKTVSKVNSAVLPTGSDVWFQSAVVQHATAALIVDWAGTASDQVIIGTYYVTGGVAYQETPNNFTVSKYGSELTYTHGRAIIEGTYHNSCRLSFTTNTTANKCAIFVDATHNVPGVSVPPSYYTPMISVKSKYVTVQDLEIRDSAGSGINMDSNPHIWCLGNNPVCEYFGIIQRNYVHNTGGASGIPTGNVSKVVVRYNDIALGELAMADQIPGAGINFRAGSAVGGTGSHPSQLLFEGNDFHDMWGECTGPYGLGYVLIRGNRGGGCKSGYNVGGDYGLVEEQNIMVGYPLAKTDVAYGITGYQNGGVGGSGGFEYENGSQPTVADFGATPGRSTLRRNNLVSANSCFHFYLLSTTNTATRFDTKDIGNTCIQRQASDRPITYSTNGFASGVNLVTAVNANNLYVLNTSTANSQETSGKMTFHHNQWTINPSDGDLRVPGTGDVVSSSTGLPGTFNFSFSVVDWAHYPAYSDFQPSGGAGANAGSVMNATANADITSTNWDWVISMRMWLPACNTSGAQVPRAEWNKELTTNFCGDARDGTPNIGAF